MYDWTLCSSDSVDANFKLPPYTKARLEIEKFCDKVNRAFYSNRRDPVGLRSDQERSSMLSILSKDFDELEGVIKTQKDGKYNSIGIFLFWRVLCLGFSDVNF